MIKDWKFWVLLTLALSCLTGTVMNAMILKENRYTRGLIIERQQLITESISLEKFSNNFIRALANLSAETGDETIKKLLADNGITFSVNKSKDENPERKND